jgi:hypothetical protein
MLAQNLFPSLEDVMEWMMLWQFGVRAEDDDGKSL